MTESEFNALQVGDKLTCDRDAPLEVIARRVDPDGDTEVKLTRCGDDWYVWYNRQIFWSRNRVIHGYSFGVINPKTGSRRVKEILSS